MTPTRDTLALSLAVDLDTGFPHLVRLYQRELFSGARSMVDSHADAEDVLQDVFLKAYKALQAWDHDRRRDLSIRPWLWTITTNTCRNRARSKGRRPTEVELLVGVQDPVEHPAEPDVTIEEWSARLRELTRPMRNAVVLRYVVGLQIGEIATIVGRPEGTVKTDIHRGLKKLRSILEEVPA